MCDTSSQIPLWIIHEVQDIQRNLHVLINISSVQSCQKFCSNVKKSQNGFFFLAIIYIYIYISYKLHFIHTSIMIVSRSLIARLQEGNYLGPWIKLRHQYHSLIPSTILLYSNSEKKPLYQAVSRKYYCVLFQMRVKC